MSGGTRPNFFLLLGLDPHDRWDQAAFERRLTEKNREWSRASSGVGKPALEAKQRIELIPQIRQVMGDDESRAEEAAAALVEADQARKTLLEDFEEALRIGVAKGYVTSGELAGWVKTFAGALTEAEIRKRISVPIQEGKAAAAVPATPQLDAVTAKTIHDRLEALGVSDLYALLGMPVKTDTATLAQKARSMNADLQRNMNKTASLTARIELLGNAMDIFKSDEMRSRYEETLRMAGLEEILHKYEQAFQAVGKVDERQAQLFVEEARSAGWDAQAALDRLEALAKQRRWPIRVGGVEMIAQQQVCGACRALNEPSARYCKQCTAQLHLSCPRCDTQASSDARACSACGFPVGNRYLVDSLLDESQRQRIARQLDEALRLIASAEQAWAGAKATDPRAQRLRQERQQVDDLLRRQSATIQQLRRLMDGERKYFEARSLLDGLTPDTLLEQAALRRQAEEAITQAQRLVAQARAQQDDSDRAIDLLQQALRICADDQEARDLLAKHPPAAPSQLVAQASDALVSLRWQASPTRGSLGYRVVRKAGAQPVSAHDGATLATVTGTYYSDTAPEVGVALYYAVFTDREGVPSLQAATLSQAVMLTPPVTQVVAQVNDGQVELSWGAPANVRRVLITRKEGAPPRDQRDGVPVKALDLHHVTDQGLRNDTAYFYRIVCQYIDAHGAEQLSTEVIVQATPQIPPAPISEFVVESQSLPNGERVATLRWTAPVKGNVVVLKSPQQPALYAGAIVPDEQLQAYGAVLQGQREMLADRWPHEGACVYTLVVVFQRMAYIGASQPFAAVDDVRDLRARNLGASVRLTWTWPVTCQRVVVALSATHWPSRQDPMATQHTVSKDIYDRTEYFDLPGRHEQDLYIVVYAEMQAAGATVYAAGVSSGARVRLRIVSKVSLAYEIRREKPLFGAARLVLRLRTSAATPLPTMILRSKQYGLPFNKTDGDFVQRVGPFTTPIEEKEATLEAKSYAHETFGRLFLEDDSANDLVDINHPSREKLRLDT